MTSTPRQTTSTPDDGSSATRSHSNTREIQKPRQPTTTTPEDASSVEMRKPSTARQPTTTSSEDASSVEMRKPGIPRQPTTATPEDASSVEMRKPSIPEQLTTSNREEASSVEMRKPDTWTYSSSRDIRTPVAARSVSPDGVMVEPHEDSSSSDDSPSSDIPSETKSDMSDEDQAHLRGSHTSFRHSSHKHKKERRRPRSPHAPQLPTLTGVTGTWQSFSFQFKQIARMHQWSKQTHLERLMSCLSDKAVKIMEHLRKNDRREYGALLKALSERFGKSDPPSTLRKQITTAAQEPDESLEEWADRIWALTLDGFPEATDTLVEKLAVEYFFRGCNDSQAALAVSGGRHMIRTIQKGVIVMKKYVCTSQQLLGNKTSSYSHWQRQVSFQDTKVECAPPITNDTINEIVRSALSDASAKMMSTMEKNILDKLMMRNKSPPRNCSPSLGSTCLRCRQAGHFARDCPSVSPPNSPGRIRCLECQDYGHVQRDCPTSEDFIIFPNDTGLGH